MDGVPGVTQVRLDHFASRSFNDPSAELSLPNSTRSRQGAISPTDSPQKASTASTRITRTSEPTTTMQYEVHL